VPLVFAFLLWMWRKRYYWRFVGSYLLLSYAGFATYVLYPMAPPWWAAGEGRIPPVASILDDVHFGVVTNPVVLATQFFKPNPVAAMPSIHAAFPVLVWLVAWRIWPRAGWALLPYPLAMGFAVVYMGEHYAIDVVAGWLYAIVAFCAVWTDWRWFPRQAPSPQPAQPLSALAPAAAQLSELASAGTPRGYEGTLRPEYVPVRTRGRR
jgi:membrane-associated phospholipid phosphatase